MYVLKSHFFIFLYLGLFTFIY